MKDRQRQIPNGSFESLSSRQVSLDYDLEKMHPYSSFTVTNVLQAKKHCQDDQPASLAFLDATIDATAFV